MVVSWRSLLLLGVPLRIPGLPQNLVCGPLKDGGRAGLFCGCGHVSSMLAPQSVCFDFHCARGGSFLLQFQCDLGERGKNIS